MPQLADDYEAAVDAVIQRVGKTLVLGIPLGLGKPVGFTNALYERAKQDSSLSLTIFTALSLNRPRLGGLGGRFANPMFDRVMGGVEPLAYLQDRDRGALPPNVTVREFFFQAGSQLDNPVAQQQYISTNYTFVAREMIDHGANVFAQIVAPHPDDGVSRVSLSCNPDVSLDVVPAARARWPVAVVGELHGELPYMPGDSELDRSEFDVLIDRPTRPGSLFAVPKAPVTLADHAIGLHASTLVPDGGTIQLGIGALGDTVSHALILRHQQPAQWRQLVGEPGDLARRIGGQDRFSKGLYGATEMFVDGFLALYDAGILKRRVVDDIETQQALNAGEPIPADAETQVLHGGFYLGTRCFYDRLAAMPMAERRQFHMTSVGRINQLYGSEALDRLQRTQARFINTGLKCTLAGAIVSDGLDNHRVLSGVGGQYNFVAQAHALHDGRSILLIKAVREDGNRAESNIVWDYPHTTIARHLRDIVVTEYGIADLRGATDRDIIARLLNITDSRFQEELLQRAQAAGKIEADYRIPEPYRNNTPDSLRTRLEPARRSGALPAFPLPCDWTEDEQVLAVALSALKSRQARHSSAALAWQAWRSGPPTARVKPLLARVGLDQPANLQNRMAARLLGAELDAVLDDGPATLRPMETAA
ncbi:MAG: acetyl-CoA hydrolase/transferase C-terminal domain-containing protein [Pseudomonadota bacterium]|nr:acetyl-CoA hydrolase/transferase C-terminal domain-containing protein [Pseudomonadota bacterium]